ncbi:MAG: TraB/GumN family protein [Candidatus Thiosymbion ectosymbiont of Robbea hypermnestra]|nr:TraB/GumN family protein [Candidatus Thiosymbion ectosymbiont of Robbea hypermnestra]
MHAPEEPKSDVRLGDCALTLLGTAHISRASAEKVRALLQSRDYDAVAVELCPSRYQALMDPDALARMDLFSVIRRGRVYMVVASLALAAYQQRLADRFGIEPGAEQRVAIAMARERRLPVLLVDREIGVTLKRVAGNLSWWRRWGLFSGLLATLLSREEVSEEEIERLKETDVLETTFAAFAEDHRELSVPLIAERDRYMAARLRAEIAERRCKKVLVVLGAGHLKGVAGHLRRITERNPEAEIAELERLPSPQSWPKLIPWLIVALILGGFGYGFYQSPGLGLRVVLDWVLINGGLSALGAAIAAGHPLTLIAAFLAAPLTSLNPTIGAGMVTGAVELSLRRPRVGDFGHLRQDTATLKGWWRNRVSRVFLVFLFSTLGSAIGTYVAGFRIFERLFA